MLLICVPKGSDAEDRERYHGVSALRLGMEAVDFEKFFSRGLADEVIFGARWDLIGRTDGPECRSRK